MCRNRRAHLGEAARYYLAPPSGHDEPDHHDSEANKNVPIFKIDWSKRTQRVSGARNVIDQNPK